jgi:uncharacterized membrane protein HdeD (DUF308 family)
MTGTEEDRRWVRSWPLLLVASILLMAGAAIYLRSGDATAATACLAAGLVCLGSWIATSVIEWHHDLHRPLRRRFKDEVGDNDEAQS